MSPGLGKVADKRGTITVIIMKYIVHGSKNQNYSKV